VKGFQNDGLGLTGGGRACVGMVIRERESESSHMEEDERCERDEIIDAYFGGDARRG